jgi:hypothetical protein
MTVASESKHEHPKYQKGKQSEVTENGPKPKSVKGTEPGRSDMNIQKTSKGDKGNLPILALGRNR